MDPNIKKLIKLVLDNPTLSIMCMVDSDIVSDDSYGTWQAQMGNCYVRQIYRGKEQIFYKESRYDNEALADYYNPQTEIVLDAPYEVLQAKYEEIPWETVIIIDIVTPD